MGKYLSAFKFSDLILPLIITFILLYGHIKKVNIIDSFVKGAISNLKISVEIFPSILLLMVSIGMFSSSGGIDILTKLISPVTSFLGFPEECVPLAIIRPLSGSGALSMFDSILSKNSPDGFAGRVASVLMGSTETTFYTLSVYYAACKVKPTKRIIFYCLFADLVGFIMSSLVVTIIYH